MNIDFRYYNSFSSRNATIRYADDLARRVNKKYPRLSASKMETFGFAKYYQPTIEKLWDKNQEMRDVVEAIINSKKPIKYYNIVNHQKCMFYIVVDNEIYEYVVKSIDLENKK